MRRCVLYFLFLFPIFSFAAGLNGTYTIGSVGDFTTISDAIDVLSSNGVSGPVVFNLIDHKYNEQLDFTKAISGVSSTNTITFQSVSGDPEDVEIYYSASSSSDNFIVNITDAQFLIFNNLTFSAKGTTYSRVIVSEKPKGNLTFIRNIFNGKANSTSGSEKNIVFMEAGTASYNLDNIEFSDNVFNDGLYGLFLDADVISKSPNLLISGNTFNSNNDGIYIRDFDSPQISNNILSSINTSGITLFYCSNSFIIQKNKVNFSGSNTTALAISSSNGNSSNYGLVANNFFQSSQDGINILNSDYMEIYFNSVNIEDNPISQSKSSFSFSHDNLCSNIFIYNNIFINNRDGYTYIGNNVTNNNSDNNNLYSTGTNLVQWDGTDYSSFSSFQSSSGTNTNSFNEPVTFNSISDLHVQSIPVLLYGVDISSVISEDIDGDVRNIPPKIGADEYLDPLAGSYTIGSGGQYSSISEAVDDLYLRGVIGPVIFNIFNGTYSEQINFNGSINGSSSINTITFQSNSGNSSDVEINYSASNTTNNFIIKTYKANHLFFNNLTFSANGTDYSRIVYSENPLGYLTFDGNIFNGNTLSSSDVEKSLVYLTANSAGNLDNVHFNNNTFMDGSWGLYLISNSGSKSIGLEIEQNDFETDYQAIKLDNFDAPKVSGNLIVNKSTKSAIELFSCENDFSIEKNKISVTNSSGKGIFIYYCTSTSTIPGILSNNMIQSTYEGITIQNSEYVKAYYNTINIDNDNPHTSWALSSALFLGPNNTNITIVNNIFNNYRTGRAINVNSSHTNGNPQIVESDYNNLYTTGPTIAMWNNVSLSTLADFQSTSGTDANSYSVDVEFISISDLHIVNSPIPLFGTPIGSITNDIDGDTRNTPPFIGADEPHTLQVDVSVFLEGPYNGSNNMNVSLNGSLPLQQPFTSPIHSGTESVSSGFFSSHTDIVDWVVVELRSDETTKIASRAGFLLNTGVIVDTDGTSPLLFYLDISSSYYIVVYQRNHLPVMSANAITLN